MPEVGPLDPSEINHMVTIVLDRLHTATQAIKPLSGCGQTIMASQLLISACGFRFNTMAGYHLSSSKSMFSCVH
jgi:hypothetical protein